MNTHTLLNGKKIDLAELDASDRAFLRDLRRMMEQGVSYFEIYRTAVGPGSPALGGRNRIDRRITTSPLYLAARDLATRAGIKQGLILAPEHERKREEFPTDGSYVSAAQAAELIGISRAAVYKAIDNGKLDILRIGNVAVVSKKSAIAYRRRREREGSAVSAPPLEESVAGSRASRG